METFPDITIVVVSFNVRELLRRCLESCRRYAPGAAVVVVDNASADASAEMVRADFAEVRLIARGDNAGFARAADEGAHFAAGPYILFLNPDAYLHEGCLERLAAVMAARPRTAVAAPRISDPEGKLESTLRDEPGAFNLLREHLPLLKNGTARFSPHDRPRRADWIVGAALLVRREAFERIGGFDPSIDLYYEDADLCLRLGDAGYEIWFEPAAAVTHVGAASALAAFGSRAEIHLRYLAARRRLVHRRRGPLGYGAYRFALAIWLYLKIIAALLAGNRDKRRWCLRALKA